MEVLSSFSRVSSVLCFGCHVVGFTRCSGNSAGLLRCRVTSPGKLSSPLKSLSSLFCGVTALARSWTSLVGFVVRVQRAGFQVSLARVGARRYEFRSTRELQEREERERALARRFKLFGFGHRPQAAGPIRVSVWGGAPPTSRLAGVEFKFCGLSSLLGKINLSIFIHV